MVGYNWWDGSKYQLLVISSNTTGTFQYAGWGIGLSGDGLTVAMGVPGGGVSGYPGGSGYVDIFNISVAANGVRSYSHTDKQRIIPPNPIFKGQFGERCLLSSDGTILVISEYRPPSSIGSVYVYKKDNTNQFVLITSLTAPSASINFGWSLSLSKDNKILAIGCSNGNAWNQATDGDVFVYSYNGSSYVHEVSLVAPIAAEVATQNFGFDVSLTGNGNTLYVGAPFAKSGTNNTVGCVHVYKRSVGGTWTKVSTMWLPGYPVNMRFGGAVEVSSDGFFLVASSIGADMGGGKYQGTIHILE